MFVGFCYKSSPPARIATADRIRCSFTSESFGILDSWAGGSDSDVPSSINFFGFPWLVFSPKGLGFNMVVRFEPNKN